jgi:DNA-binding transcriptional regulator of glucitol operon
LRLALTPRWMLWHVLTLGAMVTCGWLAAWQWGRAGSAMGSALNVGYGLQWPLFAVFFGVMWWRFLSMEARNVAETAALDAPEPVSVPAPAVRESRPNPFTARSRVTADQTAGSVPREGSAMAEYNRMLAGLAERESRD